MLRSLQDDKTICVYCGQKMKKWKGSVIPSWGGEYLWICFNDNCNYYQRGWDHTFKKIGIKASYRNRYDPNTGQEGPFPVSSPEDAREGIINNLKLT